MGVSAVCVRVCVNAVRILRGGQQPPFFLSLPSFSSSLSPDSLSHRPLSLSKENPNSLSRLSLSSPQPPQLFLGFWTVASVVDRIAVDPFGDIVNLDLSEHVELPITDLCEYSYSPRLV